MPKITFIQPDGRKTTLEAKENYSLMEIALDHKIEGIDSACGGVIACGTCHCYIHPKWQDKVIESDNELTEEEIDMLDVVFDKTENSRLACQIKITKDHDGLIIALPGAHFD